MSLAIDFIIRMLVAALVGGAIGYERELRGKVAGIRTHVLVALGACLFMIISQYGFTGADKFDAARVAASVVGGLGFLGGGIIMKNRHVSGLTTAAGIWVTGAIGMAAGAAMYELTVLGAFLLLICAEAVQTPGHGKRYPGFGQTGGPLLLEQGVRRLQGRFGPSCEEESLSRRPSQANRGVAWH